MEAEILPKVIDLNPLCVFTPDSFFCDKLPLRVKLWHIVPSQKRKMKGQDDLGFPTNLFKIHAQMLEGGGREIMATGTDMVSDGCLHMVILGLVGDKWVGYQARHESGGHSGPGATGNKCSGMNDG